MDAITRRSARILLVDESGCVLLFLGHDPARPEHRWWFTPGGGLDDGEPPAAGAARELAEETGLRLEPGALGEPVWSDVAEFPFGGAWYRQRQDFFLYRVPTWQVVTDGFNDLERECISDFRWWSVAELESTTQRFYPAELPALLRRLAAGEGAVPC